MADDELEQYQESAREMVLGLLPPEYREKLLEEGAKAGLNAPDDAMWPMVGMVMDAWAASLAARTSEDESLETLRQFQKSVETLNQAINDIPTNASQAVVGAGKTAAKEAESSIQGTTDDQIQRINQSIGTTVEQKLNTGGDNLVQKIDNRFAKAKTEVDQHKKDQVEQFKADLKNAAYEVSASEITKARRRSFMSGVGAVLLGVVITIGGSHAWEQYGPGWFQSQSNQTVLKDCGPGKHGGTWCRIKP